MAVKLSENHQKSIVSSCPLHIRQVIFFSHMEFGIDTVKNALNIYQCSAPTLSTSQKSEEQKIVQFSTNPKKTVFLSFHEILGFWNSCAKISPTSQIGKRAAVIIR